MNDEQRLKLSAYLDGALPAAEAAALELEIAKSPELLAELEELKAVSKLVKDLPQEPLPTGFRQRLERRLAAGDAPRESRDWVFLAPAYRPFAAALSGLIVALVVWDKVGERPLPVLPYDGVAVKTAAEAPPSQFDLSRQVAANEAAPSGAAFGGAGLADAGTGSAGVASVGESLDYLRQAQEMEKSQASSAGGKGGGFAGTAQLGIHAPAVDIPADTRAEALVAKRERVRAKGQPLTGDEDATPAAAEAIGMRAPKPAAPAAAPVPQSIAAVRGMTESKLAEADKKVAPMTEEERSARNEEMYRAFEKAKKREGIVGFAAKSDDGAARVLAGAGAREQPARIDSLTPNLLGAKDGVLPRALRSESAFRDAWTALKLAGDPPAVDFTRSMVVVLPSPGTLVDVKEGAKELVVTWAPKPGGAPADRLQSVALSGKAVRLIQAKP